MSSNYSAQQFNDAYLPKRLGNWEVPAPRDYSQRPNPNTTFSGFLTDENGRLLPQIKEKIRRRREIMELQFWLELKEKEEAKEEELLKKKGKGKNHLPSYFRQLMKKKKKLKELEKMENQLLKSLPNPPPPPEAPLIDPYLLYIKELNLPIIWIMGDPTSKIMEKRRQIALKIAQDLDFSYINLDSLIMKWGRRQREEELRKKKEGEEAEGLGGGLPKYRTLKNIKTKDKEPGDPESHFAPPSSPFDHFRLIEVDTTEPLKTSKLLDLLKFGMVETLKVNRTCGFLLDGFPCNLEEAKEFENLFYPVTMALYFKPLEEEGANGGLSGDYIIYPKRFKRTVQFTQEVGERLSSRKHYGKRVIQLLEPQKMDKDTVDFLIQVLKDNLDGFGFIDEETYENDKNQDPGEVQVSSESESYEDSSASGSESQELEEEVFKPIPIRLRPRMRKARSPPRLFICQSNNKDVGEEEEEEGGGDQIQGYSIHSSPAPSSSSNSNTPKLSVISISLNPDKHTSTRSIISTTSSPPYPDERTSCNIITYKMDSTDNISSDEDLGKWFDNPVVVGRVDDNKNKSPEEKEDGGGGDA